MLLWHAYGCAFSFALGAKIMEWLLGIIGVLMFLTALTDGFSKGQKQQYDAFIWLLVIFVILAAITMLV